MEDVTPHAKRRQSQRKHPKHRGKQIAKRFPFGERRPLHPPATERGAKAKAAAERSTEHTVGERSVEEHARPGGPRRRSPNRERLGKTDNEPRENPCAQTDQEPPHGFGPRFPRSALDRLDRGPFAIGVRNPNLGSIPRSTQQKQDAPKR